MQYCFLNTYKSCHRVTAAKLRCLKLVSSESSKYDLHAKFFENRDFCSCKKVTADSFSASEHGTTTLTIRPVRLIIEGRV